MDQQSLFNIGFGAFSAILGWFARELWQAVQALKSDISQLRTEIASDRVHKDDFRHALEKVESMLGKIFDKLDNKQDKP